MKNFADIANQFKGGVIMDVTTPKQAKIAETNGAILQPIVLSGKTSAGTQTTRLTGYISDNYYTSPPTINIRTKTTVGKIDNPNYVIWLANDQFAYLMTNGWTENISDPIGGEAFMRGPVWDGYSITLSGKYIYITAYTDNTYLDNYVTITYYTGYGGEDGWHYLSPVQVSNASSNSIYVGYISASFSMLSVMCCTPPPYPTPYSPLIVNSVHVDAVHIV